MHRGCVVSKGRKPGTIATGTHTLEKAPPPPAGLSTTACTAWKRLARILVARRHLTAADLVTLEGLCISIGLRDDARRTIEAEGMTYRAGALIKAHPATGILHNAQSTTLRYAAELGLTIISRGRVTVEPEETDDLAFLDR